MNLKYFSALLSIHRIDLVRRSLKSSPDTRAPYLARSAQFNLFPLLNKNLISNPFRLKKGFFKGWDKSFDFFHFEAPVGTVFAESYCQRACFEGTKKSIG